VKAVGGQFVKHVLKENPAILVVVLTLLIKFLALMDLPAFSTKLVNGNFGTLSLLSNAKSVIATTITTIQLLHTKRKNPKWS
jgi:hypothetical protein